VRLGPQRRWERVLAVVGVPVLFRAMEFISFGVVVVACVREW
jgi:hypothetical protein